MQKRLALFALFIACLPVMLAVPSSCQSTNQPQQETALNWLQQKYRYNNLPTYTSLKPPGIYAPNGTSQTLSEKSQDFQYKGCHVDIAYAYTIVTSGRIDSGTHTSDHKGANSLDLKNYSPLTAVRDITKDKVPGTFCNVGKTTCTGDYYPVVLTRPDGQESVIAFGTKDIANRAAKALHDAIVACGGKEEAY